MPFSESPTTEQANPLPQSLPPLQVIMQIVSFKDGVWLLQIGSIDSKAKLGVKQNNLISPWQRTVSSEYLLNYFLTKGPFILSQELELVDKFLGTYDTQTSFSRKPYGGKRDMHLAREGKEWYMLFSLCYKCLDYLIPIKT
uniref:Uncharacterized protein n=1 Tax=Molossus molossus TaxID=27622 RepID=A0A7J8JV99_MOLMO|nr:hypothetical protein HJG59_007830 [Molossus molossus]